MRLETAGRVSLETALSILGLFSVEMEERTHAERVGTAITAGWGVGWGFPSNSTPDRQSYKVLSMYNVHRINPQCVLTNITQPPPYWFVCAGEARRAPADPRPQALEPQH